METVPQNGDEMRNHDGNTPSFFLADTLPKHDGRPIANPTAAGTRSSFPVAGGARAFGPASPEVSS